MKLRDRIKKHAKVEFKNVGAKCPSCGFVFTDGFSDVTKAVLPNAAPSHKDETSLTICTGCLVPLRVYRPSGKVERIRQDELLRWPEEMHVKIREMQALLKEYKASLPS